MATTLPSSSFIPLSTTQAVSRPANAAVSTKRRRSVSREAGQALEILGHAIEYLADEFSLECMTRQKEIAAGMHPRVAAIEILKACNRQIYLACPEVPTLAERMHSLLHFRKV